MLLWASEEILEQQRKECRREQIEGQEEGKEMGSIGKDKSDYAHTMEGEFCEWELEFSARCIMHGFGSELMHPEVEDSVELARKSCRQAVTLDQAGIHSDILTIVSA